MLWCQNDCHTNSRRVEQKCRKVCHNGRHIPCLRENKNRERRALLLPGCALCLVALSAGLQLAVPYDAAFIVSARDGTIVHTALRGNKFKTCGDGLFTPQVGNGGIAGTSKSAPLVSPHLWAAVSTLLAAVGLSRLRRGGPVKSPAVQSVVGSQLRVPEGTPNVTPLPIRRRPRRNRKSSAARQMFAETALSPANFIMPVFVHEGVNDISIESMPGVFRLGVDTGLMREVGEARALGVKSVVIFPKTREHLKSATGEESWNPNGIAQRAIRNIKTAFPDVVVYTDVALDPYNTLGHDGIVRSDGVILNDETVHQLCKQAVSQAEAGADYVSPSDMMDGRVGAIRDALDAHGYTDVGIMAYSAKYSSAFYGPFRDALGSNPAAMPGWHVPPNKDGYQQNPANSREALLEARIDEDEGADILMVKPGMAYLDIIKGLHEQSDLPIAAYHVSGEYAMLKAASMNGWLNERDAVLEALLSMRRAGASVILTYYAKQAAEWMRNVEQE